MNYDIFNISSWQGSTNYGKHSIVIYGNYYYYAAYSHTSTSNFTTDLNNGAWVGTIVDNRETKPYFTWVPSYKFVNESLPRMRTIQFGDGYMQDVKDGINNLLLSAEYRFDNIELDEARAILHFLRVREGAESFVFVPPAPYNVIKRFKCKQWTDTVNFYNNYSITAKFTEVLV